MADEKYLSLIEHLVELRRRLIVIVIAIVIGMGVAWNFSGPVLSFIERPLTGQTYLTEIKKSVYLKVKERFPSFYAHYQLEKDLNTSTRERKLNYSAPLEPFFIQCKIAMISGLIIVLPVIFYQIWLFVAPGLTSREKRLVLPFVTVTTISFCVGAMFFLTTI